MLVDLFGAHNHFAHDLRHQRLGFVGSFLHFLVANLYGGIKASKVGDDADAEGADATVTSHDDLGNGGHTYGIAA